MIRAVDGLRPLSANEREKLMGYPQWSTSSMCKKIPMEEQREAESMRCSAIGNAS